MLTADLLRIRVRKGVVKPQYVEPSPEVVEAATQLVTIYREGLQRPSGELQAQIDTIVGHGTDFLLWRGLAKLLDDRSEYAPASALDGPEVRRRAFELAFDGVPVDAARRAEIVATLADEFAVPANEVDAALYADLADRQVLTTFKDIDPEELIARYNLALAQAVFYRARSMNVVLRKPNPDRLRYLMGALKFHGLMHRAAHIDDTLEVQIDGPASLFKLTRKYGLKMAIFLPALVLLEDWSLTAELEWKGKDRVFELSSDAGLQSHYKPRGLWRTDEEQWFEQRFEEVDTDGWTLERRGTLVELRDGEVIVADYVLTAPDGREVAVEIVSFWRGGYLRRRIEMLDSIDQPFVLVVSERLKADREKLEMDLPLQVVFYKGVILANKVIEAAEAALEV